MEENKTDWKQILGMSLIFAILMYMFFMNKEEVQEQKPNTTTEQSISNNDQLVADGLTVVNDSINPSNSAETLSYQTELVDYKFSTKGAYLTQAELLKFKTYDSLPVYLVNDGDMRLNLTFMTKDGRKLNTADMLFTPQQSMNGENKVFNFVATPGNNAKIEFRYEIKPDNYMVDFTIRSTGLNSVANTSDAVSLKWDMQGYRRSKSIQNENRYTEIKFEYDGGSDDYTGQGETAEEEGNAITWAAYKQHFFSSILVTDTPFKSGVLRTKNIASIDDTQNKFTKEFSSEFQLDYSGGELMYNMDWYFGPTDYDILENYDANLEEVVDLGWGIFGVINKYVIRPLFTFITSPNYLGIPVGIGIILLTFGVRLLLSPVLYKSYLTQAKMKILRPEIEKVTAKYKDDALKKQQETMRIQREAGASPLSGCLPALLQMPVFFALFKFFPTAIELRQKSFLWADDLSSYDEIFKLPFHIPVYGDHVSLFPILASVAIFFYMQMTTGQNMAQAQQPGMPNMKFIMYLSPLFMLVFFNNYAAGLSLYYFVSNLITIGLMLVIKNVIIDKDKVLAKIEKAKAKPKKKGRFAKRMEQMMEQAQAQQELQKKKK